MITRKPTFISSEEKKIGKEKRTTRVYITLKKRRGINQINRFILFVDSITIGTFNNLWLVGFKLIGVNIFQPIILT